MAPTTKTVDRLEIATVAAKALNPREFLYLHLTMSQKPTELKIETRGK